MTPRRIPGRIEIRTAPDCAHPRIPTSYGVRYGAAPPSIRVDGGPIDRVLRRFSAAARVTRSYGSKRHVGRPHRAHLDWDDLEHRSGLSRTFQIDVDPAADPHDLADALRDLENIEQAGPVYLASTPFGAVHPGPGDHRAFELVGAETAIGMEPGDPATIVAIIDSGVSSLHPELEGRLRSGVDTIDLVSDLLSRVPSYGRVPRDIHDCTDLLGHGTACAGIISARGLSLPPGIGGATQILPMRALTRLDVGDDDPTAVGAIPDINAAVKLAVDLGAKVLNLSFGTPASALRRDDPIPHAAVIEYAIARGAVPIAASGNRGDYTRYYPACLPGVIAVGSVDGRGVPSRFTCRGPHVALCAPGERIPSVAVDGYTENTGTSFAAPFVTAAAALLVARAHRSANPIDAHGVRRILMESARAFPSAGDHRRCGSGTLDIPAALRLVDDSNRAPPELRLIPEWRGRQPAPVSDISTEQPGAT